MKTVDFRTSAYFSPVFIFNGFVIAFIAVLVFPHSISGAIILSVTSLIIFTTHYRLKVDFEKKNFRDYVWILGLKTGKDERFDQIEYVFITKSRVTQKMQLRGASTTTKKDVYDGYIRFSEHEKVHLITMDEKPKLLQKMTTIGQRLGVGVVDHSPSVAG